MKYNEVVVGQTFLSKKHTLTVLEIKAHPNTGYDEGELYCLMLTEGQEWFGWAEREISVGLPV